MKNKVAKCQESPEIPLNPPFPKGERVDPFIQPKGKALLPLKKGGREGFQGKPFSNC
jgi:hypothetical protein